MKDRESCDGAERVLENKEMYDSEVISLICKDERLLEIVMTCRLYL